MKLAFLPPLSHPEVPGAYRLIARIVSGLHLHLVPATGPEPAANVGELVGGRVVGERLQLAIDVELDVVLGELCVVAHRGAYRRGAVAHPRAGCGALVGYGGWGVGRLVVLEHHDV